MGKEGNGGGEAPRGRGRGSDPAEWMCTFDPTENPNFKVNVAFTFVPGCLKPEPSTVVRGRSDRLVSFVDCGSDLSRYVWVAKCQ